MSGRSSILARAPGLLLSGSGWLLVCCMQAHGAGDDGEPSVTPYRPTVSDPADMSAPGWLEGEFGGLRTLGGDSSRSESVPWLLKYAFDENHGVLVGGSAYVSERVPGGATRRGFGDLTVEWKQRFPVGPGAAFGIEAGVVAPTAANQLGVGKAQWLVNGIYSADVGALHLDLNLGEARGGDQAGGVSAWQTTWAAAVSAPLAGNWGAAFELSGAHRSGTPTYSEALLAFNYNVSKRLSLDAGAACGLARAAHDRSFFAGATMLIGRLR